MDSEESLTACGDRNLPPSQDDNSVQNQRRRKDWKRLRKATKKDHVTEVRDLLSHAERWQEKHLLCALRLAPSTAMVRVFAEAAPDFFEDGGGGGASVLHVAATTGRAALVRALLEAGVAPDSTPSWARDPPLWAACAYGHAPCVQALLEHGADTASKPGTLPLLHYAVYADSRDCVLHLLERGVALMILDDEGRTPLHWAASRGAANCVKTFLERGADPNAKDSGGTTPLKLATYGDREYKLPSSYPRYKIKARVDYAECVSGLIRAGAVMPDVDSSETPLLFTAMWCGNVNVFRRLLKEKADVCCRSHNGDTLLHSAAASELYSIFIQDVVHAGVDVNITNDYGETALHQVVGWKTRSCKELIKFGADVSLKDNNGWTALHRAAESGRIRILRSLLDAGSDVSQTTNDGELPLHLAAGSSSIEFVQHLLEFGTDVNVRTNDGKTPLHFAALSCNTECIEEFVKQGADIHARDNYGWTPVHCAAEDGVIQTIQCLLKHGLDLRAQTDEGKTALHLAARAGNENCVRQLLWMHAPVDARDFMGRTALHEVAHGSDKDTARVLLVGGADPRARNLDGETPADVADSVDMQRLLRRWALAG